MELEIELKLTAPSNAGLLIEQKLLPQLGYSVTKNVVQLSNYYFDTEQRTLRKNDIGLRIRGNGQQLEQTLKTAGKSVGGLHQRPEYNVQLADKEAGQTVVPNLSLFDKSAWPLGFDISAAQHEISTLFITDFERHIYLLDVNQSTQIEMVWDLGSVSANGKSEPICEIELELKKGSTSEIFGLAKKLLQVMYLAIGTDSKAARGYRLADNLVTVAPNVQPITENNLTAGQFVKAIENGLSCLQYFSAQLSRQYSFSSVEKIAAVIQHLGLGFSLYEQAKIDMQADAIYQRIVKFSDNWQKLLADLPNMQQHSQRESAVDALLFQAEVTQLQLDIVQFSFAQNRAVNN
ncbi:CYTH domain-containing protein [Paraglaciecola aquimarina]|uniref:CYTH domain-containing protein n=1 Tax=Paraglaciecola aquimarina TaxID=1235557 RepID=A0ABU3SVD1_9ALTE|nr:CYTH domain-containing protein [Paraglaciecola aquimarina]MDU0353962.1 CYTH domain-containing protein [Paraglaciecola aquimarina]